MAALNRSAMTLLAILVVTTGAGCSTLGITLYPSGARLTSESKQVLDSSRIPRGIPRENAKVILHDHVLEPGDAVVLEPVNLEQDLRLPADQTVLADGTLDLGPYGRLIVAGRTVEQAELLIEQQIAYQLRLQREQCKSSTDELLPDSSRPAELPPNCNGIAINVRLLEPVHRFYVLGEVNAPGSYPLVGYETVLDAIVNAGGLTDSANPCQILLARPTGPCECRVTLPICYREIVQMGNTTTNYQLQPGDRIFVASRSCLDELMFWRASRPCPRCSGGNCACCNPPTITHQPMAATDDAMISPGSVGRPQLADELLLGERSTPTGAPTPAKTRTGAATPENRAKDLGDYFYEPLPSGPNRAPASDSDIDGELDFSPEAGP